MDPGMKLVRLPIFTSNFEKGLVKQIGLQFVIGQYLAYNRQQCDRAVVRTLVGCMLFAFVHAYVLKSASKSAEVGVGRKIVWVQKEEYMV